MAGRQILIGCLTLRLLSLAVTGLGYTLLVLTGLKPALAQEPPPFEISLIPQVEYAVMGQPFTYTIVVTNVSRQPLGHIVVFMATPTGTTFASARQNINWFATSPPIGEVGKVGWTTLEPISPGEVTTFELVVNVLNGASNQQLTSEEYGVIPMGGGNIIASGPPLKVQVVTLRPTVTSTPGPTALATDTPLPATVTLSAPLISPLDSKTANTPSPSTSIAQAGSVATSPAQPTSTTNKPVETPALPTTMLAVISLSILVIAFIGLAWFLRRR